MRDEFFIGWKGRAPERTGRFLKQVAVVFLVVAGVLGVALPAFQRTVAEDPRFEFGNRGEFRGVLVSDPVPMLVGDDGVVYFLVSPLKHGFDEDLARRHHLRHVRLRGTRIHRGDQEMIEVVPESMDPTAPGRAGAHPLGSPRDLGEVTLRGEVVDSKCYLGVMNPGHLKTHRACAVNCIEGGIPPVLLVRDRQGEAACVLLVGAGGESVNDEILGLVAEPVAVTGRLKRQGDRLILYAGAGQFRRE